jgi:similar to spore coat protein
MTTQGLALHETLEMHELLTFKTVCMTKSKTMQALVTDEQLRGLLQQDVQTSGKAIQDLQGLLANVKFK